MKMNLKTRKLETKRSLEAHLQKKREQALARRNCEEQRLKANGELQVPFVLNSDTYSERTSNKG